jgi:hypothetical protein
MELAHGSAEQECALYSSSRISNLSGLKGNRELITNADDTII